MRRILVAGLFGFSALLCSERFLLSSEVGSGQAAPAKTAAEIAALGPQVGQRVPDFSLVDQDGRTRDLKSVLGPKGAMIVFFRSAEW
jgi:hypothetical protein